MLIGELRRRKLGGTKLEQMPPRRTNALTKQPSVLLPSNKETALANERAAELKLALEKEIAARQPRQIAEQRRPALKEELTKFLTRVK